MLLQSVSLSAPAIIRCCCAAQFVTSKFGVSPAGTQKYLYGPRLLEYSAFLTSPLNTSADTSHCRGTIRLPLCSFETSSPILYTIVSLFFSGSSAARCCLVLFLSLAGPVARWMAVKASAGNKITDNVETLEITAGGGPLDCYEAFKTVRIKTITATIAIAPSIPLATDR